MSVKDIMARVLHRGWVCVVSKEKVACAALVSLGCVKAMTSNPMLAVQQVKGQHEKSLSSIVADVTKTPVTT